MPTFTDIGPPSLAFDHCDRCLCRLLHISLPSPAQCPGPQLLFPSPGETLESLPFILGTGPADTQVAISIDSLYSLAGRIHGNGRFLINVPFPLATGEHTLCATIINLPCVQQTTCLAFHIDALSGPVVEYPPDNATLTYALPTITGQAGPGNTVTLCLSSLPCGTTLADQEGFFVFPVPQPLLDGDYILIATQSEAGGSSSPETVVRFTVVTLAPTIELPVNGSSVADPTPTFSGASTPGYTVEVCVADIGCAQGVTDPSGIYFVTLPQDMPDGNYEATVVQISPAGFRSPAASVFYTIDTVFILFQLTNAAMGTAFRTLAIAYNAAADFGDLAIFYVLLPPGSAAPTEDEIIGYNDVLALTSGVSARGQWVQTTATTPTAYTRVLTGREVPLPLPGETGVVDGYQYFLYLVAVDPLDNRSGVITLFNPVMGMPFDGGDGDTPFIIRELTGVEIAQYPDLQAGNPLNLTGVDETARMLENIERLQVLFDETGGTYGMGNALALNYQITTPMDLGGYAAAYGGTGWRPIGNSDASLDAVPPTPPHVFTGSIEGEGPATLISNLSIQRTAAPDNGVQYTGLFGAAEGATFAALNLVNAQVTVIASPAGSEQPAAAGTLVGTMRDSMAQNIGLDTIRLIGGIPNSPANHIGLGTLTGAADGNLVLLGINAVNLTLAGPQNALIGGVIGILNQDGGSASMEAIAVDTALLGGTGPIGGVIGYAPTGLSLLGDTRVTNVTLMGTDAYLGGCIGQVTATFPVNLIGITILGLANNAEGNGVHFGGGLVGRGNFAGAVTVADCHIQGGTVTGFGDVGGLFGWFECVGPGSTAAITQCQSTMTVYGLGDEIGGFFGHYRIANGASGLVSSCICSPPSVTGNNALGGFVGLQTMASGLSSRFESCTVTIGSQIRSLSGNHCGGFVGRDYNGHYADNRVTGTINGNASVGGFMGGGFGTYNDGIFGILLDTVSFEGSITVTNSLAGGIVAVGYGVRVVNSTAQGTIISPADTIGGILGYTNGYFSIEACHVDMAITNLSPTGYTGGIAARATQAAVINILRCTVTGTMTGPSYVGGILGYLDQTAHLTATGCTCSAALTAAGDFVGGILASGYVLNTVFTTADITSCLFTGRISGLSRLGGVVGYGGYYCVIGSCLSSGSVISNGQGVYIGGIAVRLDERSRVDYCVSQGPVQGISSMGGILGYSFATSGSAVGVQVANCYATGPVTRVGAFAFNAYVAGILGQSLNRASVSNCYSTSPISTVTNNSGNYMGGIAGSHGVSNPLTVQHCYAINASLTGPTNNTTYGRVVGLLAAGGVGINNYAWDGIIINGFTPTPEGPNTKNGETVTTAQVVEPSTHYVVFGAWDFANVWTWSSNPAVNLPILQSVPEALQLPQLP